MYGKFLRHFFFNKSSGISNFIQKTLSQSNYAISPIHLNLEITRVCNLKCYFCPSRYAHDSINNLTAEKFDIIISKIKSLKVLTLLGRGETLMNQDLPYMVKKALSNKVQIIDIVTNGTLFREENIKKLEGVTNFTISVDSCDSDEFRQMRGCELSIIEKGIEKLLKTADWGSVVTIQTLVTSRNMHQMKDMIKWAKKVGAKRCIFILMIGFDEKLDKLNPQFNEKFNKFIAEVVDFAKKEDIIVVPPKSLPYKKSCFEPWRTLRVDIEGNIYPCCYIFESDHNWTEYYKGNKVVVNQEEYLMGNIFKDKFQSVWNGEKYKKLRRALRKTNVNYELSVDKFIAKRNKYFENSEGKQFNYCNFCLYRWSCAC